MENYHTIFNLLFVLLINITLNVDVHIAYMIINKFIHIPIGERVHLPFKKEKLERKRNSKKQEK